MTKKIPANLLADLLNRPSNNIDRHKHASDHIPYMHVSSLIQTGSYNSFCPRQFVLRYMERATHHVSSLPPKFDILYITGSAIGDNVVNRFIREAGEYRALAWGDWRCQCGKTIEVLSHEPKNNVKCALCKTTLSIYKESHFVDDDLRIVGHPDFMLRQSNGVIHVVEVKSIDRADVIFDEMKHPLGDHTLQASFYYWMLKKKGYKVSKFIRVLYVDRGLADIYTAKPYKEFRVLRISRTKMMHVVRKAIRAYHGCVKGVLPNRICDDITDTRANGCLQAISCFYRTSGKIKRVPTIKTLI